ELSVIAKKAADLLAKRPHFKKELENKLLKKGYSEELIEKVLDDFERRGYLDDRDHALLYIEELRRKRFGKYEIVRRLVAKGLKESTAREMTWAISLEKEEREHIRYLLNKRRFNLKDPKGIKKALDFFIRRGFTGDIIREVFKSSGSGGLEGED
ncbi:MAG: regulatory protein RecX, partial [Proteobacteria bacterium]|nr:regulatory protein RecX [Pseudomonadota bacterium]